MLYSLISPCCGLEVLLSNIISHHSDAEHLNETGMEYSVKKASFGTLSEAIHLIPEA